MAAYIQRVDRMGYLIRFLSSIGLEMLAAGIVLVPLYSVLNRALFHNTRKSLIYCVFSFYLAAVYHLVGLPNVTYIRFEVNLNLIPFLGFFDGLQSSILNILLFVPLGVGMPILWEKFRSGKNTVLFGLGMSLAIEILQMFTFRATDVNDLMTNTLGTFLGWLLAGALIKAVPDIKRMGAETKTGELYLVCAVGFLVMFFVQPFLFSIIWDIVMH